MLFRSQTKSQTPLTHSRTVPDFGFGLLRRVGGSMRHTAMLGIALHVMTIHRVMRPLIVVAHLVVAHALVVAQALMVSLHVDGAKAALVHQSRSRLYRRSLAKDDGAALGRGLIPARIIIDILRPTCGLR